MFTRAGQPTSLCLDALCGGGVREGTLLLAQLSARFQLLPLLLTSKLGPSGADSQVGGFVCILGLVGLSNELSCEAGSFSCHLNPPRFFQSEVLRLYFPTLKPWVSKSVLLQSCSSQFICTQMWDRWVRQPLRRPHRPSSSCLATNPLCPSCPSLPLLPVWMNVSSLTPWLSDFRTVGFSGSSGNYYYFFRLVVLLLVV